MFAKYLKKKNLLSVQSIGFVVPNHAFECFEIFRIFGPSKSNLKKPTPIRANVNKNFELLSEQKTLRACGLVFSRYTIHTLG